MKEHIVRQVDSSDFETLRQLILEKLKEIQEETKQLEQKEMLKEINEATKGKEILLDNKGY